MVKAFRMEIKFPDGKQYRLLEGHPDLVSVFAEVTKVMEEYRFQPWIEVRVTQK
jgi:hypothetical protein